MTWNYRIVAVQHDWGIEYGIHEVYYDENEKPIFYTSNPVPCVGDTLQEAYASFEKMRMAFGMPTLTEKDFP